MAIAPGDSLRFVYSSGSLRYLAILSLDPNGKASPYFPSEPQAARVEPGQNVPLPASVELDQTVGAEKLHAIFCDHPFALSSYLQQLQTSGVLKLGADCSMQSLEVFKR